MQIEMTIKGLMVDPDTNMPIVILRDKEGEKVLPIWVNTIQYPIPTPQRCWDMGIVLREAIESWPGDERVVILGTGGLSHQLQGARAGFINQAADRAWLDGIAADMQAAKAARLGHGQHRLAPASAAIGHPRA